ncbi:uncharacterized protein PgNI_08098, partial [Pyricularia grisea]|uniref:Uncharacterized protein n=1 Tax=Pyricularia grisea TaxID=148305 RepID=A0A6P8AUG3_PYRGI
MISSTAGVYFTTSLFNFGLVLLGLILVCKLASVVPFLRLGGWLSFVRRRKLPLPPGPPRSFFLGHYRTVPFDAPFKKYAEWGKQYQSDVLYFSAFGK